MADNNNGATRANLSEMDKIFIPQDLDDNVTIDDLANYKCDVKFWRSVPENYRMVKVNRFTQKITRVHGFGLKFMIPFLEKTILVPSEHLDGVKTFDNISCQSSDKIDMGIKIAVKMSIVNPALYKKKGCTQFNEFNTLIEELMREYTVIRGWEDIYTGKLGSINAFDPTKLLEKFENECGIKIKDVRFLNVTIPAPLKKKFDDVAEAEQEQKAQKIKLATELERVQEEAKMTEIRAQAEAKSLKLIEEAKIDIDRRQFDMFAAAAKKVGMTDKQFSDFMNIVQAGKGNAFVSVGSNNNTAANVAAGVRAANSFDSSNTQRTNNNVNHGMNTGVKSNSDRLMEAAEAKLLLGEIKLETCNAIVQILSRPEFKLKVDKCNDDDFEELCNRLLGNSNTNDQASTHKRR